MGLENKICALKELIDAHELQIKQCDDIITSAEYDEDVIKRFNGLNNLGFRSFVGSGEFNEFNQKWERANKTKNLNSHYIEKYPENIFICDDAFAVISNKYYGLKNDVTVFDGHIPVFNQNKIVDFKVIIGDLKPTISNTILKFSDDKTGSSYINGVGLKIISQDIKGGSKGQCFTDNIVLQEVEGGYLVVTYWGVENVSAFSIINNFTSVKSYIPTLSDSEKLLLVFELISNNGDFYKMNTIQRQNIIEFMLMVSHDLAFVYFMSIADMWIYRAKERDDCKKNEIIRGFLEQPLFIEMQNAYNLRMRTYHQDYHTKNMAATGLLGFDELCDFVSRGYDMSNLNQTSLFDLIQSPRDGISNDNYVEVMTNFIALLSPDQKLVFFVKNCLYTDPNPKFELYAGDAFNDCVDIIQDIIDNNRITLKHIRLENLQYKKKVA